MVLGTANLRRIAKAQSPRARFYLALGYLIWALLPHFNLIYHTHEGGSHFHASFSPAEVAQANQVLDALGPAALADAGTPEVGGLEPAATAVAGAASMAADAASGLHGHYWEDANLAGLASLPGFSLIVAALLLLAMIRYQAPLFRFAGKLTARGPPAFLPA